MARYYFDTHNGKLVRDDVGIECDSFQSVRAQAAAGLADFARDIVPSAKWCEMAIRVRDDQGRPVMQAILRFEIRQP
ncbi:DUF6894 family protein [Bradyrhizobium sp. DASA03007]|uniref:DUF6894 family protein n=1 Tax=unclassified Bradyrhizobium TaxID=2631580 RepID=UPI003F6FDB5F